MQKLKREAVRRKMLQKHTRTKRPAPARVVWSFLSAFFGIAALALIDGIWLAEADFLLVIGSFGASAVLLFGTHLSPLAQPYNILVGHVVSAFVGVTVFQILGQADWMSASLAVAGAIAVMQLSRSIHPPGGATALIAVIGSEQIHELGYMYVVIPVFAGAMIMLIVALIMNNIPKGEKWPVFWY